MTVRVATEADNAALCRLARRAPMAGSVRYCLERDPDFFCAHAAAGRRRRRSWPSMRRVEVSSRRWARTRRWSGPWGPSHAASPISATSRSTRFTEASASRASYSRRRAAGSTRRAADFGIALVLGGNRSMSRIVESRSVRAPFRARGDDPQLLGLLRSSLAAARPAREGPPESDLSGDGRALESHRRGERSRLRVERDFAAGAHARDGASPSTPSTSSSVEDE
jgi:hypothetical protein